MCSENWFAEKQEDLQFVVTRVTAAETLEVRT